METACFIWSVKKTFLEVHLEDDLPKGLKRCASWCCGDRALGQEAVSFKAEAPCVFFGTRLGCHDRNCGFQHVALSSPAVRPRKSKRDAYKQAVEKAFLIQARL